MSDNLQIRGNHPDGVRAICKECGTIVLKDTEHDAKKTADDHNEQMHDGEDVAGICAWDIQPLFHDGQTARQRLNTMLALKDTINSDDLTHEEKRKILGLTG